MQTDTSLDFLQGRPEEVWREAEMWAAAEIRRLKTTYRNRWQADANASNKKTQGSSATES